MEGKGDEKEEEERGGGGRVRGGKGRVGGTWRGREMKRKSRRNMEEKGDEKEE